MNALARLLHALAALLEPKVSVKELEKRIAKLEARQEQMVTDIGKCKLMVGLNQILDVSPNEV